jgi:hypothetical protein
VATYRKDIRPDIYVSCPTCGCEIIMLNTMSLPREFSVRCPNCEGRKFYQANGVHDHRDNAEKAQSSGKIQFGIRRTNERDQTSAKPMQPKSRFNAMATWLLH